jgi:hypothetical protein
MNTKKETKKKKPVRRTGTQEAEALKTFRESLAQKNPAVRPSWTVGT